MPTTYVVRMTDAQYENAVDALEFGKMGLSKKDREKISHIQAKFAHARQHPTLGLYEAYLSSQEGELMGAISEGLGLNVEVMELR